MKLFIFLCILFTIFCVKSQVILQCTSSYCETYENDNPCPNLPEKCTIQNSTHNGIFLPYHGPCNCCEYCLENIDEGKTCAVGSPSSSTPTAICGPGLSCKNGDDGHPSCQTIDTQCTKAQAEYDKKELLGILGHLEQRPKCDDDGNFQPVICIPGQNCFCVDKNGQRIFGEMTFTSVPHFYMNCECSRKYEEAKKLIGSDLTPLEHFRCAANGDYDSLQCIDESCLCVNPNDGSPYDKEVKLVNLTMISNETLLCYNHSLHAPEGKYYFECEQKYIDHLKEIEEYTKEGFEVIGSVFPNCQLDGNYAPIQSDEINKFCADEKGKLLEDFKVPKDNILAKTMNCNCARARMFTLQEKPECCANGNYKRIQCRRHLCRCVDSNGMQIEKEVHITEKSKLKCFVQSECTES